MDTKIVFLRRTQKEIEIFGGDVYIDIDGKNIGVLGLKDFILTLRPGEHNIKMYKSHSYNTFIGNAETNVTIIEGEDLLVKYSPPMIVSQPGHIVISDLMSSSEIEYLVEEKEKKIVRDDDEAKRVKKKQEEKSNNAIIIFLIIVIIGIIIYCLSMGSVFNYNF